VHTGDWSQPGSSVAVVEPAGPRYFLIKSRNEEDITESERCGLWTFPHNIAETLTSAYEVSVSLYC